jgi:hypothetical protein
VAEPLIPDRPIVDIVWDKISSRLGGTSETVQKIRFGRGAVGKICVITFASITAIAGMALRLGASAIYVGIGAVVVIALGSFALIFYIVCKRPELAVLEGTELVMYQHVTMGAKGYVPGNVQETPQLAPGKNPPSAQIGEGS